MREGGKGIIRLAPARWFLTARQPLFPLADVVAERRFDVQRFVEVAPLTDLMELS